MTIPDDNPLLKKSLRARMRRLIMAMPTGQPAAATAAVGEWLDAHPAARTLAVFAALPGEVDLSAVVARHPARRWVYPRMDGGLLQFHAVENPQTALVPGAYGVREPCPTLPRVGITEIDAFFCPGLAFDPRGGRLGRGMGYYDRMLARARPDALKIGVCFPAQHVDDTHAEAHDIAMDEVLFC